MELERTRGLDVESAGREDRWGATGRLFENLHLVGGGCLAVAHRELHGDVTRLIGEGVGGSRLVRGRPVAEVPVVGELVEVGIRTLGRVELDRDAGQRDGVKRDRLRMRGLVRRRDRLEAQLVHVAHRAHVVAALEGKGP